MPLFAHQDAAVDLLTTGTDFYLAHEMRLGKTRTALTAYRHLYGRHIDRMLIISPLIATGVWRHEATEVGLPEIGLLRPTSRQGIQDMTTNSCWVTNYDYVISPLRLPRLMDWVAGGRTLLVLDESHFVRNPRTKRHKAVAKLAALADRTYLLSGTPMVNSSLDLYWQLRLLNPTLNPFSTWSAGVFGNSFAHKHFNVFTGQHEYRGIKHETTMFGHLPHLLDRRLRKDCLDMGLSKRNVQWVAERKQLLPHALTVTASLEKARSELAPLKADLTIKYLEEALPDRPVVVFGWHHSFMNTVSHHFDDAPIISGDTSDPQRQLILERFRSGQVPIIVVQLQAGGVGIDLSKADNCVVGELHWSAVDHRQAEARLENPGKQTEPCAHYLLCDGGVEEYVWGAVLKKGSAIDRADHAASGLEQLRIFMDDKPQKEAANAV